MVSTSPRSFQNVKCISTRPSAPAKTTASKLVQTQKIYICGSIHEESGVYKIRPTRQRSRSTGRAGTVGGSLTPLLNTKRCTSILYKTRNHILRVLLLPRLLDYHSGGRVDRKIGSVRGRPSSLSSVIVSKITWWACLPQCSDPVQENSSNALSLWASSRIACSESAWVWQQRWKIGNGQREETKE